MKSEVLNKEMKISLIHMESNIRSEDFSATIIKCDLKRNINSAPIGVKNTCTITIKLHKF